MRVLTALGGGRDLLEVLDNELSSRGLDDLVPGGLGVVRLSGSEGNTLGHFLKAHTPKMNHGSAG